MNKKLKDNPEQFLNIYSREAKILDVNEDKRTAELVVATEQPVVVMDWAKWEPVREIVLINGLRHPDSVVMLDTHSRWSINDIKGSVKDFESKEKFERLGTVKIGTAHFSKTAEKEWTLRQEGHLTDSSIGYRVNDKETVIIPAGKGEEVNGKMYRNDYGDGLPLYIRTGADLLEVSLVPIGADQAAKFRSMFSDNSEDIQAKIDEGIQKRINELNSITKTRNTTMKTPEELAEEKRLADEKAAIKLNEDNKLKEDQRKAVITKLAAENKGKMKGINLEEMRDLYITGQKSVESFAELISDNIVKQVQEAASKPTLSLTRKEIESYSLVRAVAAMVSGDKCAELEISQEYAKNAGRKIEGTGRGASFFIPHNVIDHINRNAIKTMKRDVNTTATTGGEFVGTEHLGSEWIDVLRNMMALTALGVTYLPGRKGNIEIPKLTSGNVFGWAATENAAVSEGSPVSTEITMSPKRGGTYVEISKQAILQSDPALDIILTQDGREVMARGFDAGGLHGSGSGGQFTGVKATTNTKTASLASIDWDKLLAAIAQIKAANAMLSPLKWCTNATVEALLMGRTKVSGYPVFLMDDNSKLAGRESVITEQVNASHIFLGAWNQAYLALWDAVDVTVDPYTLATTNMVRITFNQLADFAVRYPEAFFWASDLS